MSFRRANTPIVYYLSTHSQRCTCSFPNSGLRFLGEWYLGNGTRAISYLLRDSLPNKLIIGPWACELRKQPEEMKLRNYDSRRFLSRHSNEPSLVSGHQFLHRRVNIRMLFVNRQLVAGGLYDNLAICKKGFSIGGNL